MELTKLSLKTLDKEFTKSAREKLNLGSFELEILNAEIGGAVEISLHLRNKSNEPVIVDRLILDFDQGAQACLEHGLQSWSGVRIAATNDYRPQRRKNSINFLVESNHADYENAGKYLISDQFSILKTHWEKYLIIGFLKANKHFGSLEITDSRVRAHFLLDFISVAPGNTLELSPLYIKEGQPGQIYSDFLDRFASVNGARESPNPSVGWCSWYYYFSDLTPSELTKNLELAQNHGFDLFQIDDAYQSAIGDWLKPSNKFLGYYPEIATTVRQKHMKAGVWTAPFLATKDSQLFRDNPSFFLKDESGQMILANFSPSWGGPAYALDVSNPKVKEWLFEVFSKQRELGFSYFKIDFLYGAILRGKRQANVTRAQAFHEALQVIREAVGQESFILGCGSPIFSAVPFVDAMRVSADTAPYFEPKAIPFGYEEISPSLKNSIVTSALRSPMHRRLFQCDPDCLMLRQSSTSLSKDEISMAKALVIGTGGYIIVSDNLEEYSEDTWESLKELRQLSLALDVDKKVDIVNPFEDPLRIKGKKIELKISKGPIDLRTNDIIFQGKNESLSVALVKNGNDNRSRAGSR